MVLDEESEAARKLESARPDSSNGGRAGAQAKATGPTSVASGQGRRARRFRVSMRRGGPLVRGNASCRCVRRRLGRLRRGDLAYRRALQDGVDSIELLPRLHAALLLERRVKHIIECLAA